MKTGFGVTTLSEPRFAIGVPSVASPTRQADHQRKREGGVDEDLSEPACSRSLALRCSGCGL